jgi:DNA polymerase-3 subunit epsilon
MDKLFFDIETPNCRNDRLCQIGFILDRNGKAVREEVYLVDPETHFDDRIIAIHGITPDMVCGKTNFCEIWSEIAPLFEKSLVIGHNIYSFDLTVIGKCISHYGMEPIRVCYSDTLLKAKHTLSGTRCGLEPLSEYFGLESFGHHDALEDARRTREIYYKLGEISPWTSSDENSRTIG